MRAARRVRCSSRLFTWRRWNDPRKFTLATVLSDTPLTIKAAGAKPWQPQNFDHKSHGDVLLYQALAQSYNLASARLGMQLGVDTVVDMLARLGVEEGVPRLPALLLGAGEYSPMDMATMYQTIAAGGFRMPLRSIRDIVDANGEPLKRYPLEYDRTVSLQSMHLLHFALRAVVREGTGHGVYRYLPAEFRRGGQDRNHQRWTRFVVRRLFRRPAGGQLDRSR